MASDSIERSFGKSNFYPRYNYKAQYLNCWTDIVALILLMKKGADEKLAAPRG